MSTTRKETVLKIPQAGNIQQDGGTLYIDWTPQYGNDLLQIEQTAFEFFGIVSLHQFSAQNLLYYEKSSIFSRLAMTDGINTAYSQEFFLVINRTYSIEAWWDTTLGQMQIIVTVDGISTAGAIATYKGSFDTYGDYIFVGLDCANLNYFKNLKIFGPGHTQGTPGKPAKAPIPVPVYKTNPMPLFYNDPYQGFHYSLTVVINEAESISEIVDSIKQ